MNLPHFLQGKPKPDIEAINKARQTWNDVSFTMQTRGWQILMEEVAKAEQWEFDQSVTADFLEKVMFKPAVYAKHMGFVNGIRYLAQKAKDFELAAERATKDLELLERYSEKEPQHEHPQ